MSKPKEDRVANEENEKDDFLESRLKARRERKEREKLANTPVYRNDQERMIAELREIHWKNEFNPYFGGAIDKLNRSYARASGPQEALDALFQLGNEWTRVGDPDRGMETFDELKDAMDYLDKKEPGKLKKRQRIDFEMARAIAAIRKGENENCIDCLGGDGCLFPIGPKGVHKQKEGSTTAVKHLERVLELDSKNTKAIWLLNIAHMTLGTYPDGVDEKYRLPEERLTSEVEFPKFRNMSSNLNIDTLSHAGGVVVEDFDGDEDFDIFVSSWATDGQCRYFRNDGVKGFQELTSEMGLDGIVGGLNTRQIDYDNDGDPDVLILRGAWLRKFGKHPNSLLRNDGGQKFVEVAFESGIAGEKNNFPTQTAQACDYDLDGDLDLFVGNENYPDQLFRNDGGKFVNVAAEAGVDFDGYAKGSAWGDVDNDGDFDLYVSNYGGPNRLYRNEGDGTFRHWDVAGLDEPKLSFSCWFFDYDNDGNLDLFVAAYDDGIDQVAADYLGRPMDKSDHDRLFKGDGKGGFEDVSQDVGLGKISQTMGSNFGDLNNDGRLDFYLATGSPSIEALQPNLMYLNQGGKHFADVSIAGGFSHLQKGHAIAFVDLDHDGDQDVFAELGGAYKGDAFQNALFENPGFDSNWLKLRLIGSRCSQSALGTRVEVIVKGTEGRRSIHRVVDNGSSFGSNPLRLHFGWNQDETFESLRVIWPGEMQYETLEGIEPNQAYRIVQSSDVGESSSVDLIELVRVDWSAFDNSVTEGNDSN